MVVGPTGVQFQSLRGIRRAFVDGCLLPSRTCSVQALALVTRSLGALLAEESAGRQHQGLMRPCGDGKLEGAPRGPSLCCLTLTARKTHSIWDSSPTATDVVQEVRVDRGVEVFRVRFRHSISFSRCGPSPEPNMDSK